MLSFRQANSHGIHLAKSSLHVDRRIPRILSRVRNKKYSAKTSVIKSINWFKGELNVISPVVLMERFSGAAGILEINSFLTSNAFWKDVPWKVDPFGNDVASCSLRSHPCTERMMSSEPCPYIHISYNSNI